MLVRIQWLHVRTGVEHDPLAQLGLLATIAATYSGFIAVFIAFTRDGRFEKADGHFVQAMVLGTIGVIVMSLTPVRALRCRSSRCGSTVTVFAIAGGVPSMIYQAWHQSRLSKEEASRIPVGWHAPGWALGFLALTASSPGLAYGAIRPGLYVAGVTLMLLVSIWSSSPWCSGGFSRAHEFFTVVAAAFFSVETL